MYVCVYVCMLLQCACLDLPLSGHVLALDTAAVQFHPSWKVSCRHQQHMAATVQASISVPQVLPSLRMYLSFRTTLSFLSDLIGILAGHLYFFVMYKYPQDFGGQVLISTPQIL